MSRFAPPPRFASARPPQSTLREVISFARMLAAALSVAFFFSGAAGLIFQVVWFHRAGLVFGSSVWAVTIVLSSFMGGLALGNALAGKYTTRVSRPLLFYAKLEFIIALECMSVTILIVHLRFILRHIA